MPLRPRFFRTALLAGLLALAATCSDAPSPTQNVAPPTAPLVYASCSPQGEGRTVQVATVPALRMALFTARPGDAIALAEGTYQTELRIRRSGTPEAQIKLCGNENTVLQGVETGHGYGVHLDSASHWVLSGFTIRNYLFGVYAVGASHNVLDNLTVENMGQAGVHFRAFSSDNVLQNSRIQNTGLTDAETGEGVYLGTYRGQWDTYSGGLPDASDRNRILNNRIGPNVRSELIDVKEGTSGGIISGNVLDGTGMVQSQFWVNSLIELKGNGYTISRNRGRATIEDGFDVFQELPGWANNNLFSENEFLLDGARGVAVRITPPAEGNVVSCNNVVSGGPLSNVGCR